MKIDIDKYDLTEARLCRNKRIDAMRTCLQKIGISSTEYERIMRDGYAEAYETLVKERDIKKETERLNGFNSRN